MFTRLASESSPFPRVDHTSSLLDKKIYILGGVVGDEKRSNSLISFDVTTSQWKELSVEHGFPEISQHCAEIVGGSIYVFGGASPHSTNFLYKLESLQNEPVKVKLVDTTGEIPPARVGHSMVVLPDMKKLWVFGGQGAAPDASEPQFHKTSYIFDTDSQKWHSVAEGSSPSGRCFHTATRIGKNVYVFGGFDGKSHLNDLHVFDVESHNWTEITVTASRLPSARAGHCAAALSDGRLLIHGGYSMDGLFSDYWVFDPAQRVWALCHPPPHTPDTPASRSNHTLVIFDVDKATILGGRNEDGDLNKEQAHYIIDLPALVKTATKEAPTPHKTRAAEEEEGSEDTSELSEKVPESMTGSARVIDNADMDVSWKSKFELEHESRMALRTAYATTMSELEIFKAKVNEKEQEVALLNSKFQEFQKEDKKIEHHVPREVRALTMDLVHLWNRKAEYTQKLTEAQRLLDQTNREIHNKIAEIATISEVKGLLPPVLSRDTSQPRKLSKVEVTAEDSVDKKGKGASAFFGGKKDPKTDNKSKEKEEKEKKAAEKKQDQDKKEKEKKEKDKAKAESKDKPDKKKTKEIQSGADPNAIQKAKFHLGNFLMNRQGGSEKKEKDKDSKEKKWEPTLNSAIVDACIDYLTQNLTTVGLFRVPGSASAVEAIYVTFQKPETINFKNVESPHDVAGAFKQYLRYLITPIIPYELFDEAIKASATFHTSNEVKVLRDFVLKLPPENSSHLRKIINLLAVVTIKADINKMTAENIGIVFGPTLVRQKPELETPQSIFENTKKSSDFVVYLLANFTAVFMDPPAPSPRPPVDFPPPPPPIQTPPPPLPITSSEPPQPAGPAPPAGGVPVLPINSARPSSGSFGAINIDGSAQKSARLGDKVAPAGSKKELPIPVDKHRITPKQPPPLPPPRKQ